ncbi:response regulator transcription factor [Methylobacterium aerolatum]|uniref:Two-component system nitrate/nitrite response regulator NarL n=1 Tax=Methylobacterium aerolatum TaxID=418708 RepID=A0ABU0I5J2_9HYPH|nr:response regulator transcription factor [Methylobacterium aerolatum]MDQ0449883.1 two-component system nitrate/nitrite response regulator NarL [Methylobacterium aerolatum]GJD37204.1 Transcriptional regulatory protein LiaR [Methylobacterium aerolatum]
MGIANPLKVVLADDHPVVLAGLVALLRRIKSLEIAAVCSDGDSAFKSIVSLKPDVACIDIRMPGLTGIEIVQRAKELALMSQFVFLTGSVERDEFDLANECGASAIFHKDTASEDLLAWFEERVSQHLRRDPSEIANSLGAVRSLTVREWEIARLVARGMTNKEIARDSKISEGTVKIHLYNIYQKIGVSNRIELANYTIHNLTIQR